MRFLPRIGWGPCSDVDPPHDFPIERPPIEGFYVYVNWAILGLYFEVILSYVAVDRR